MVWGLIETFRHSLKYRGGWQGLFNHMYTVSSTAELCVLLQIPLFPYSGVPIFVLLLFPLFVYEFVD
jgi:hypothetical protein